MQACCPRCGCTFDAKRSSYGASYALKWDRLRKWHLRFLAWWLGSAYARTPLTKEQICSLFQVDVDGINGRMSELKALQLVHHDPENSTYRLNIEAAAHVLNNGGKLDDKYAQLLKHDTVMVDAVTVRQHPPY